MSFVKYMKAEGEKQGLISSGCGTFESIGNRFQVGHENEIQLLYLSFDITRIENVNHQPFEIIKPVDKSTPLWLMAIENNELIDLIISRYWLNSSGLLEKYGEIKLHKAHVTNFSTIDPHCITNNEEIPHERITFLYRAITINQIVAGTSAYSINNGY